MEHRGGCGGDSDSGDGAGLLCQIPWTFLEEIWDKVECSDVNYLALGMIFMPRESQMRSKARNIFEDEAKTLGLETLGWRNVPVNE